MLIIIFITIVIVLPISFPSPSLSLSLFFHTVGQGQHDQQLKTATIIKCFLTFFVCLEVTAQQNNVNKQLSRLLVNISVKCRYKCNLFSHYLLSLPVSLSRLYSLLR